MRRSHTSLKLRDGAVERSLVLLVVGALVSLALIVLAGRMLLTEYMLSDAAEPVTHQTQDPAGVVEERPAQAPSETVERVLESVQVYVSDEDFAPALTILKKAVANYPSDTDLRLALADLHMRVGDYKSAYEQYATVLAGDRIPDPSLQFTAGTLASEIGSQELAEEHFAAALSGDPDNAEYAIYLANVQLAMNKLDEAGASAAIAARLAPGRVEPWVTWAHAALRGNDAGLALQQVRKAREIRPDEIRWAVLEARALTRMGDAESAVATLGAFPASALTDPEAARVLASALGMLGRVEDGAQRVVAAAMEHDDDASLAMDAAVWMERAGDRQLALRWARRAETLGSDRARGWIESLD